MNKCRGLMLNEAAKREVQAFKEASENRFKEDGLGTKDTGKKKNCGGDDCD